MPLEPSQTEKRLCVSQALRILRVRDGGKFSQIILGQLTKLVESGASLAEALSVARWARETYDGGDRFRPLLDPMYLWSVMKFPVLLAALQTAPTPREGLSNIDDPDTRREWHEDYLRRLREKGLT